MIFLGSQIFEGIRVAPANWLLKFKQRVYNLHLNNQSWQMLSLSASFFLWALLCVLSIQRNTWCIFQVKTAITSWIFGFFLGKVTRLGFIDLQPTCGKVNRPVENIITSIQPVVASLKVLQLCGKKNHLKKLVGFQNSEGKSSSFSRFVLCRSGTNPSSFTRNLPNFLQVPHWSLPSPKLTLEVEIFEMDGWIGWKMNSFWESLFAGAMSVSGRASRASVPKMWRHATVPDVVKRWVNEIQVPGMVLPHRVFGDKTLGTKFLASRKVWGEVSFQVFRSRFF